MFCICSKLVKQTFCILTIVQSAPAQQPHTSKGEEDLPFRPRPAGEESTLYTPQPLLGRPEEDKNKAQSSAKGEDEEEAQGDRSEDRESSEEENPLVRTRPGYVFDKRIGIERKRIAMDDFTEEKYRRQVEKKEKTLAPKKE
jgi:hypothetical protein